MAAAPFRRNLCLHKQDAGYTNVQNMTGSIFEWANERRPMRYKFYECA